MATLFWDASGLAKRYAVETGNEVTDILFDLAPDSAMDATVWGYTETFSILLRKRNDNRLDASMFNTAVMALRQEIINSRDMSFLTVDESAVVAGLLLMDRHNLNATDASLLAVLIRYARSRQPLNSVCILVAAYQRLLCAARGGLANI